MVNQPCSTYCSQPTVAQYLKLTFINTYVKIEKNNMGAIMTINEYQRLAMTTLNPALDKKDVLINGVMGLCGESGEVIDIVKKWLAQGHELDREKIKGELGDVAWYLAEVAYALDIPLEDVLQGNIDKLKKRYPEGFDTEKSVNRDKNEN